MAPRGRQALAVVLAVVAGLAAVAGVASWQLRDALADSRGFGDRALAALDEPAVRAAVAEEIAAQARSQGAPDAARTETAVDAAMRTRAFRDGFRAGARELHAALVDDRDATLRVDLSAPLAEADPELAALLGDIGAVEVVAVGPGELPADPRRAADALDLAPTILLPLACFALAASLLVAARRRTALLAAAVAVAAGGALLLLALAFGRSTVVDLAEAGAGLDRATARSAVGGAWDSVLAGVQNTGLGALVAGVVGAAAAAIPWGGGSR